MFRVDQDPLWPLMVGIWGTLEGSWAHEWLALRVLGVFRGFRAPLRTIRARLQGS